jgi:hypothetical protein
MQSTLRDFSAAQSDWADCTSARPPACIR